MHYITFDIEEWYIEKKFHGARASRYKLFDEKLEDILGLLNEQNTKATFFCLGRIATDFPEVVRRIAKEGHEIGCHSNEHDWLTKLSPEMLRRDTLEARKALQDESGQEVVSYRAPAFSITEGNRWALDVLAECGIRRDASIFPAARDFGGYPSFPSHVPCDVPTEHGVIREFPIPVYRVPVLGKDLAFSGGGYFRLFPYGFVESQIRRREYAMCYFHISDLIQEENRMMTRQEYETYFKENGSLKNRVMRYVKGNIGRGDAWGKLCRLVMEERFSPLAEV
jgi:polysaccharide deacetylase family protein (PEP-CTERM system associated)